MAGAPLSRAPAANAARSTFCSYERNDLCCYGVLLRFARWSRRVLEHAFGRDALQERLDERIQYVRLSDDRGMRRRRHDRQARRRQRLTHVAHCAAAEKPEQRDRMVERCDVGIACDNEYWGLHLSDVLLPGHRLFLQRDE